LPATFGVDAEKRDDQALAGIVLGSDRGHRASVGRPSCRTAYVAFVEERNLQRAALGQRLNVSGAQRRDPVEIGWAQRLIEALLRDHAAVAHEHDARRSVAPPSSLCQSDWTKVIL